jgi:very-short-patch-repair endonuclease
LVCRDVSPKPKAGRVNRSRELRKRPFGLKFRRQHPSGAYILDFYCSDARLAIEVDGMTHDMGDYPVRDEAKDCWFARAGIVTPRIPASAILVNLQAALASILAQARARPPLHHPASPGGPPPRDKLGQG